MIIFYIHICLILLQCSRYVDYFTTNSGIHQLYGNNYANYHTILINDYL